MKRILYPLVALSLCLSLLLSGCGDGGSTASIASTPSVEISSQAVPQTDADNAESQTSILRPQPECLTVCFQADLAEEVTDNCLVDFTALSDGYVGVSAQDDQRLKFQISLGEQTYTYDLPGDGTPTFYPMNLGDGIYTFKLLRNVEGTKYAALWSEDRAVTLSDAFAPYLRPSQIVNYTPEDACVALAYQLTDQAETDLDIVSILYTYLADNIAYDYDKAATVESGYLPDPDDTLATGTGICFDYAALAAAMLRSQGIPCQLITGYVGENAIYHAWNRIYLENQGWITVEIKAPGNGWKRVDITFAASGTDASALEDDALYTNRYTY